MYRIRHVHMYAHGISMGGAPAAQLSPPYNLVRRSNYLQGACLRTHTAVNSISGPWFEALVRRREQLARYKGRNAVANGTAAVSNRHGEVPMAATRLATRPADVGPNRRCKAPGATEPSPCVGSLSHATRPGALHKPQAPGDPSPITRTARHHAIRFRLFPRLSGRSTACPPHLCARVVHAPFGLPFAMRFRA